MLSNGPQYLGWKWHTLHTFTKLTCRCNSVETQQFSMKLSLFLFKQFVYNSHMYVEGEWEAKIEKKLEVYKPA